VRRERACDALPKLTSHVASGHETPEFLAAHVVSDPSVRANQTVCSVAYGAVQVSLTGNNAASGQQTLTERAGLQGAAFITGEPFAAEVYDFGSCRMTERNSEYISTMLAGRLTPPPRFVYTLSACPTPPPALLNLGITAAAEAARAAGGGGGGG
jgi:hypothetical protein